MKHAKKKPAKPVKKKEPKKVKEKKKAETKPAKSDSKKKKAEKSERKPKPRVVRYRGEKANFTDSLGCDIITLYLTCKLGYAPIRMIMGLSNDSKIERVIYQHKLFRADPDNHDVTDLQAESATKIDDIYMPIIKDRINKYNTADHPYIAKMLKTQTWYDLDPSKERDLIADFEGRCRNCSSKLDPKWDFCPKCGKRRNVEKD